MSIQESGNYNPEHKNPKWNDLTAPAKLISRHIVFEQRDSYTDVVDGRVMTPSEGERLMVAKGDDLHGEPPKGLAPFFHIKQTQSVWPLDFFEACKYVASREYLDCRWIHCEGDCVICVPVGWRYEG